MAHKYVQIAFTPAVRAEQVKHNSRDGYAGMDQGEDYNFQLSENEAEFLAQRDSFYMASVSETLWPYVQHRGGPKGFMRVIDATTIGFADFSGNRQYVSTGNFKNNDRVALFFMDYPNRRRLKMMGRIQLVQDQDWEMLAKLEVEGYRATVERGFIIKIEGFDWNCPQHITPRFSEDEVEKVIAPILAENEKLKAQQASSKPLKDVTKIQPKSIEKIILKADAQTTEQADLSLVITGIRQLTPRVRAYELRRADGQPLPSIQAGAHLNIPVQLDNGQQTHRHYSICSNPKRTDAYEIAILNTGKGASLAIHNTLQLGQAINCDYPANYFQLNNKKNPAVLIAAGIGITPIKSMAQALECRNNKWHMHYAGQSLKEMAFQDRLQRAYTNKISFYAKDKNSRMDIAKILSQESPNTVFYVCGPNRLIEDVIAQASKQGIDKSRIVYERFKQPITDHKKHLASPIQVTFSKSGKTISMDGQKSILDAAIDAGISTNFSCKTGQCKTCAVKIIKGHAEHRDDCLSEYEQKKQKLMCPCVSSSQKNITLDM